MKDHPPVASLTACVVAEVARTQAGAPLGQPDGSVTFPVITPPVTSAKSAPEVVVPEVTITGAPTAAANVEVVP